ncbi:MAG: autotransporter assembly complex family protein [Spongiibacteraceae bacterium]
MLRSIFFIALLLIGVIAHAQLRIDIDGASGEVAENIRNHIGTISDIERDRERLLRKKLNDSIRNATQSLGYYESTYSYQLDGNTLRINVNLGQPVVWRDARIQLIGESAALKTARKMIENSPFKTGEIINHATYETFKRELLETCQHQGFLDAHYAESRLIINSEEHYATVILTVDGSERYRFANIDFTGSMLDADLIQRLSPIEAGAFYDKTTLTKLQRNLQDSRYFREIDVQSDKREDHTVALKIKLTDAPSHQFSVGVGYGTDTGPRAKFRWERPYVNARGHKLTTDFSVSQPQQELNFEYHIPLQKPLDESLNLTTSWTHKVLQDTDSTVGSVGFFFSDRYAQTWVGNYGATYYDESYKQGSEPRNHTGYIAPDINFTQIVLPLSIDPKSGRKFWVDALGSTPALGAETSFLRINGGYKQIFNPFGEQLFIGRVEGGVIATSDISLIPSSQRFFTGGDQTVRGYDFESLSTEDSNGELIGGRYLNVASAEYSFKVAERWRTAVFTDTGRAFNDKDEPWHKSVGAGVRWLSPVGQIRVDIAFPINDDTKGWRLHIFIGPPL